MICAPILSHTALAKTNRHSIEIDPKKGEKGNEQQERGVLQDEGASVS